MELTQPPGGVDQAGLVNQTRRMPLVVNVQEAKTRLSELLARVERGEEVVIARAGRPIAHLSAVAPAPQRAFGFLELTVPESFFEPLAEEELAAWE
jgi:prevent-host-death family protein